IPPSCSYPFPLLPKHHSYASTHPFIGAFQQISHVGALEVIDPSFHIPFQGCFPFFIVIHPSAACEFSYPLPQLVHGFLVYPHSPSLCALVKPVSEKLDSPGIGCHCFLSVYFEEQLLFNER